MAGGRARLPPASVLVFPLVSLLVLLLVGDLPPGWSRADDHDALPTPDVRELLLAGEREGPAVVAACGRAAVPALQELLRDRSVAVRRRALLALAGLGRGAAPEESLRGLLDDAAPSVRWAAAEALGACSGEDVVGDLADALGRDPADRNLLHAVLAGLGRAATPEAAGMLRHLAGDPGSGEARRAAMETLLDLAQRGVLPPGAPPAPASPDDPPTGAIAAHLGALAVASEEDRTARLARLVALLAHEDDTVTDAAGVALRRSGPAGASAVLAGWDGIRPSSRGPLLDLLARAGGPPGLARVVAAVDDPLLGEKAVRALAPIPGEVALGGLARALEPTTGFPSLALRRRGDAAAKALAERGAAALEALRTASRHPDARTRSWAVTALLALRSAEATEVLLARVGDEDSRVRQATVRGLGERGGDRALAALVEACADEDPDTRRDAVTALGRLGRPEALERVHLLRDDPDPRVALAALRALSRFSEEPLAAATLADVLATSDVPERRLVAAEALAASESPAFLRPLVEALRDRDPSVREAALEGLARRADPRTYPALVSLLVTEADPVARALALSAFLGGEPRIAVPLLEEADRAGLPEERRRAREALDRLAAVPVARAAAGLEATDPLRRAEAARALGALGLTAAIPYLERALRDPDPAVVRAALEAMTRITAGAPPR